MMTIDRDTVMAVREAKGKLKDIAHRHGISISSAAKIKLRYPRFTNQALRRRPRKLFSTRHATHTLNATLASLACTSEVLSVRTRGGL